jgi:hypothetical protein
MGKLYEIEAEIHGRPPAERRRVRRESTAPLLKDLRAWMNATLTQVSAKSPMALAIGYALSNWTALTRFVDDGRIEAHNNAAERALRGVAPGRKNYLHVGSDVGGDSAAVIYTLIGSAKLNGIDPDVRAGAHRRAPDQPDRRAATLGRGAAAASSVASALGRSGLKACTRCGIHRVATLAATAKVPL